MNRNPEKMKLNVQHQDGYSRGALLLRTFPGLFYIYLPHALMFFIMGCWGVILLFVAFWVILLTGRYPENMFDYQLGLMRWGIRVLARLFNLAEGYPAFGIRATDDRTELQVTYPEQVSRGLTLARLLLGIIYVVIPHAILLIFRGVFLLFLLILAWWAVLLTGRYPGFIHAWAVGQLRWVLRVTIYLLFMSDNYPAFTGDEIPGEAQL